MTGDRPDPARRLIESGLLDVELYEAVRGRSFPGLEEAAADFVGWAMPQGVPPHAGVDLSAVPKPVRAAWRRGRPRPLIEHLSGTAGPGLDPAHRSPMLDHARRIGSGDPVAVDWSQLAAQGGARPAGRVSVVIGCSGRLRSAVAALDTVLEHAGGHDVEVVVVDDGLPVGEAVSLASAVLSRGSRVVRLPRAGGPAAWRNAGCAAATGEFLAFLDSSSRVREGWLHPLLRALQEPPVAAVQPLVVGEDEAILSAGFAFPEADLLPVSLLLGHQRDDALGLARESLRAIAGSAMVIRAADLIDANGFDEGYESGLADIDLCLRLGELGSRTFRVVPEVVVTQEPPEPWPVEDRRRFVSSTGSMLPTPDPGVYRRIGLHVSRVETDAAEVPAARVVLGRDPERPPDRLRWSLKLPSTRGHWGDRWGDTHFANGLARALRALGQDVVTCRAGAHDVGPTHLDDVSLVIRGALAAAPTPGTTSVLWVISHPDDVDQAELDGFDLVLAASTAWSRRIAAGPGREVLPLLQASEFPPAPPVRLPPPEEREVVFVGSTHDGRRRRLVEDAVASGIPLAVYGTGWDGLVPDHQWRGDYVRNEDLPALYRRHGLVLADHWPDMAAQGFVANRVFDAVAAGARVLSDDVAGIEDLFGPDRVRVCRSPEDVRTAVLTWPADASAVQPGGDLTFADRAEALLSAVLATRSGRGRARG